MAVVGTYLFGTFQNLKEARSGDDKVLSPDRYKSVQVSPYNGQTQLYLHYHKYVMILSTPLSRIDAAQEDVKIEWVDNTSVEIEYPTGATVSNESNSEFLMGDTISIKYLPK